MKDDFTQAPHQQNEPKWLMPLVDVLLAVAAFVLAYVIRYQLQIFVPVNEVNRSTFLPYYPYVGIYAALLFLSYQGSRLYRNVRGRSWLEEVYTILNGVTSATVLLMAISFVAQPREGDSNIVIRGFVDAL